MRRLAAWPRVGLIALLCAVPGAGCQPSVSVAPVSGKVTVEGKALTAGQVSFIPVDETTGAGLSAGTIGADGEYTIYTAGKAGAPPGKYKVTVTPSMVPTGGAGAPTMTYNSNYRDAKSTPVTFEVVNNPEPGRYDLKLAK